jgi:hypothetical protein
MNSSYCSSTLEQAAEVSVDDEGSIFEDAAGELEDDVHVVQMNEGDEDSRDDQLLEDVEKPQLFSMWLQMKKEGRADRKLQALVEETILPEDIHQHFKEFAPPSYAAFMQRLQYERECAERALTTCGHQSWLLRRSSINRQPVLLHVPRELGLGDRLRFGENDTQRPIFYAFSYLATKRVVAHVLIMKWHDLWAHCKCVDDGGTSINQPFFVPPPR